MLVPYSWAWRRAKALRSLTHRRRANESCLLALRECVEAKLAERGIDAPPALRRALDATARASSSSGGKAAAVAVRTPSTLTLKGVDDEVAAAVLDSLREFPAIDKRLARRLGVFLL